MKEPRRLGKAFAARLLEWFESAMRPLPWRRDYDPYRVWISEIMLQQTQMERGVRYFEAWTRRFPDLASVARAAEGEVLAAWEGLGYYSRARNLHAAARRIAAEHGGVFPREPAEIRALPGVGGYTAAAIASIAFNLPEPAVDANVLRVFSRLLDLELPVSGRAAKAIVHDAVLSLMPFGSPRLISQALMELGALICGKNPKCADCPVAKHCAALRNGTVPERPRKNGGAGRKAFETVAAVIRRDGRVFVRQRPPGGLWAGLWEVPGGRLEPGEEPAAAVRRHAAAATGLAVTVAEKIAAVRHGFTVHSVTLHGYFCDAAGGGEPPPATDGEAWIRPEKLAGLAFPAGDRKLLERLGWKGGQRPHRRIPGT